MPEELESFTTDQLKEEIERRENLGKLPQQINQPNLNSLRATVAEYIEDIHTGKYHPDSDDHHYIFEEAVKALYGQDIFEWINKNIR